MGVMCTNLTETIKHLESEEEQDERNWLVMKMYSWFDVSKEGVPEFVLAISKITRNV